MNTWNPRQEIISAAHRWYWIAASFFIGVLLGWLVSLIWPAPYRASLDLYVGLNAYRTTRDLYIAEVAQEQFRNLDDYKNWQMNQLNSLAVSDEFLEETIVRLEIEDSYWQSVSVPSLREMLSIAWRDTGDWHFSARTDDPSLAAQTVTVWSQVVVEKTGEAVGAAREMVVVDSQLNAVSQAQVSADMRQVVLVETQLILSDWEIAVNENSADQEVTPLEHWNIVAQVATTAGWNSGWTAVLESTPPLGSLPADYDNWLQQVNALIEAELALLPSEQAVLEMEHAHLAAEYKSAADQSHALSANLEVAQIKAEPPKIVQLRSTGTLILVGGILGILAYLLGWIVQISRKTEQ